MMRSLQLDLTMRGILAARAKIPQRDPRNFQFTVIACGRPVQLRSGLCRPQRWEFGEAVSPASGESAKTSSIAWICRSLTISFQAARFSAYFLRLSAFALFSRSDHGFLSHINPPPRFTM